MVFETSSSTVSVTVLGEPPSAQIESWGAGVGVMLLARGARAVFCNGWADSLNAREFVHLALHAGAHPVFRMLAGEACVVVEEAPYP